MWLLILAFIVGCILGGIGGGLVAVFLTIILAFAVEKK